MNKGKKEEIIKCIVCDKNLLNWAYKSGDKKVDVHPMGGLHFRTYGHYGSSIFDPMGTGEYLDVAICDLCVLNKIQNVHGTGLKDLTSNYNEYKEYVEKYEEANNQRQKKAYDEGYESFPQKECPYDEGSLEHEAWWNGWGQCKLTSAHYE